MKEWIDAGEANRDYFEQLRRIWDTSKQLALQSTADENKAWERFQQRVGRKDEPAVILPAKKFPWLRIAAAAILIMGIGILGYLWMHRQTPPEQLLVQAQQNVLTDTLPDGSFITLNKQSSVSYPATFTGGTRDVALKGEAFFNVAPDKKKPFVIRVNDVQVTVVGTSFNIKSEGANTEVVVETGIVRVTKAGNTVELKAGEKITVADTDSLVKEAVTDQLYNYYRTREFVCDNTPLWKLVEVINEAYGVNITIGRQELRDQPLNTTFNNESLDQVLHVISLTFDITVTRNGNQIILQ